MKKQFLVLTTAAASFVIISCSKNRIEPVQPNQDPVAEQTASSHAPAERLVINPLNVNLEGSFQFNGDLKDQTRKLAEGTPTTRGVTYTSDRKGKLNGAIYLNGTYGIKLKKIPQQTHTSISVWVKPGLINSPGLSYIAGSSAYGPVINHISNLLSGGVVMNSTIPGGVYYFNNTDWRHLVVTYDGADVKFYVNGILADTNNEPGYIPTSLADYFIGCLPGFLLWKGKIDDLRFYSRTLTTTDVQQLYSL